MSGPRDQIRMIDTRLGYGILDKSGNENSRLFNTPRHHDYLISPELEEMQSNGGERPHYNCDVCNIRMFSGKQSLMVCANWIS